MGVSRRDLAKGASLALLAAASLLPFLLDDASSGIYYYAPLVPAFLVGYAFRSWWSMAFAVVPLAIGIAFGHPAGFDPETGTEWLFPEWVVYVVGTPVFLLFLASGIGVARWERGRHEEAPGRS